MTQANETRMLDAAFASDIPASWQGAVGGYLLAPRAFHPWTLQDWERFPGQRKLPIWVQSAGGETDGDACVAALQSLGVPPGVWMGLDMETRANAFYVNAFGTVLDLAGYKTWVYGSASTVFRNPPLHGYWVADFADIGPFLYLHPDVRATQFATDNLKDASTVKDYAYFDHPWWI